jgi:hypothetical protein
MGPRLRGGDGVWGGVRRKKTRLQMRFAQRATVPDPSASIGSRTLARPGTFGRKTEYLATCSLLIARQIRHQTQRQHVDAGGAGAAKHTGAR